MHNLRRKEGKLGGKYRLGVSGVFMLVAIIMQFVATETTCNIIIREDVARADTR